MSASPLQYALQAQARGHAVFPINRFKAPAIRSAHPDGDPQRRRCHGECGRPGHGLYDATTDPVRAAELFALAKMPTGYAVACGRAPHRLIGIDLDIKQGDDGPANFRDLADTLGFTIPDTIQVTTPSGGMHLWLAAPEHVTIGNSAGKLGPGIDVRGSGGMLIGPGSRATGGAYRLRTPPDAPIAPIPPQLLELLRKAPTPRRPEPFGGSTGLVTKRITALVATVESAKQGQRNSVLYWSACRMSEAVAEGHLTSDEGRELLLHAADRAGLDYAEADSAIASAFRGVTR